MHDDRSDERLMLAWRDGDPAAFECLYRRYRTRLYRHLAHQCGDSRLAEDLFQDIWLKVIGARADYEPLAKFSTWIFRIAHNRLLDHYRRHGRDALAAYEDGMELEGLPAGADCDPGTHAERRNAAERIAAALEGLPAPQREAFLLAEAGELSLEEIAAATGSGRETVKSRLRYAIGKLRAALEDLL